MTSPANQAADTAPNLPADATTPDLQCETPGPQSPTSRAEDQMAVDPVPAAIAELGNGGGEGVSDLSEGNDLRVSRHALVVICSYTQGVLGGPPACSGTRLQRILCIRWPLSTSSQSLPAN
jgi:hypothetical protein